MKYVRQIRLDSICIQDGESVSFIATLDGGEEVKIDAEYCVEPHEDNGGQFPVKSGIWSCDVTLHTPIAGISASDMVKMCELVLQEWVIQQQQ